MQKKAYFTSAGVGGGYIVDLTYLSNGLYTVTELSSKLITKFSVRFSFLSSSFLKHFLTPRIDCLVMKFEETRWLIIPISIKPFLNIIAYKS